MHDAGTLFAANAAEIVDVVQKGVDQGTAGMACCRMDDHTSGLVDHSNVAVLIENRKRQLFRLGLSFDRVQNRERNLLTDLDRLIRLGWPSGDLHVGFLYHPVDPPSRPGGPQRGPTTSP